MAARGGTRWTSAGMVATTTSGAVALLSRCDSTDNAAIRAAATPDDGPMRS